MCGQLDCYRQAFAKLQGDINKEKWPGSTCFLNPQKPLLLLSVLDLIESGQITRNFIEPSPELVESFRNYWEMIMPGEEPGILAGPFYRLADSGFWHLVSRPGSQSEQRQVVSTIEQLKKHYLGAKFDNDLYPLLVMKTHRDKLYSTLLTTCFSMEAQAVLGEQKNME